MRSYEDYPEDNNLGLLLDDSSLHHSISLVDHSEDEKPPVDEGWHRIKNPSHVEYIKNHYEMDWDWSEHWRSLPFQIIESAFSVEEMTKMMWNSCIQSEVSEEYRFNPKYRVLGKVDNAIHHWCYGRNNYNHLAYWYNSLSRFSFDIPDTEVRLDYATYFNPWGYSKYTRTFLDGPFAFLIYYKGKHVLTVAFAPSTEGVLITQIQTTQKKGNRWLYKLPCHYVEYVVKCMSNAFPDAPLYIADGVSLADRIRETYRQEDRHNFDDTKHKHVASVYDREFVQFEWTSEQAKVKGTVYNRLKDRNEPSKHEWFSDTMNYRPYKEVA